MLPDRMELPLERRRWIKARWRTSQNNRAELDTQTTAWQKLAAMISQVLETA